MGAAAGARISRINSDCVPQAFSHFSIAYSQRPLSSFVGPDGKTGRCLVCDLQGCFDKRENTFLLSDPCIHSDLGIDHLFGATDNGARGIRLFLRSHKCNEVCKMLRLPENTDFVEENIGQLENSSVNTSFVSIAHTKHLRQRQGERGLADIELQAAKKHGAKERMPSGSIKHKLAEVHYVTSKDQTVGVTGFRREQAEDWRDQYTHPSTDSSVAVARRREASLGVGNRKKLGSLPEPTVIPVVRAQAERPVATASKKAKDKQAAEADGPLHALPQLTAPLDPPPEPLPKPPLELPPEPPRLSPSRGHEATPLLPDAEPTVVASADANGGANSGSASIGRGARGRHGRHSYGRR